MDAALGAARFRHVVFTTPAPRARPPQLSTRPPADTSATSLAYDEEAFLRSLFFQANLNVRAYRMDTLKRRIPACLRVLRCESLQDARRRTRRNPAMLNRALDALLIGVSGFFRDAQVFDALRRRHLPELLDVTDRPLRVLSLGCSNGSELYSVAMLLAEANALAGADLLGVDCRAAAVETAKAGAYPPESLSDIPPNLFELFCRFDGKTWRVTYPLRSAARWAVTDGLKLPHSDPWDLILCRNMAMYLRPHEADALWQRLERSLVPGGLLILGKAERPDGARALRPLATCVYRRDPDCALRPDHRIES